MTLKLEIGKAYVDGNGQIVKIVRHVSGMIYPFSGDNGETYTDDGQICRNLDHPENLVSEAAPELHQPPQQPTERVLASGLTLREEFAKAALISMGTWSPVPNGYSKSLNDEDVLIARAQWAVRQADALVAELEGRG